MNATLYSEPATNGFDAWVTNERGEVIGEGWCVEREAAEATAIKDAELSGGHLLHKKIQMKHPHKIRSLITRLSQTVDCLIDITDMIPKEHLHSEYCGILEGNRCSCDFDELREAGRDEVREARTVLKRGKPEIRLVTASGAKIVMDAETAAFLTSPDHLEKMLERMGQPELAAWMKQQDLAADALQFEVRAGLADRKKILPLKEAA